MGNSALERDNSGLACENPSAKTRSGNFQKLENSCDDVTWIISERPEEVEIFSVCLNRVIKMFRLFEKWSDHLVHTYWRLLRD